MNSKSLAQAQVMVSSGAVVCLIALAGWWAGVPSRYATSRFFADPAPQAPAAKPEAPAAKPEAPAAEPAASAVGAASVPARTLRADIVRVLPNGDVVVAGRAEPGARVTLLDQGVPLAEMTADPKTGEFVFLPPRLKAGEHKLSLRSAAATTDVPAAESAEWRFVITAPASAVGAAVAAAAPAPAASAKADRAMVARGDTLWALSRARLGSGALYPTIFQANAGKVRNPDLIYPGQELTIP